MKIPTNQTKTHQTPPIFQRKNFTSYLFQSDQFCLSQNHPGKGGWEQGQVQDVCILKAAMGIETQNNESSSRDWAFL